MSQSRDNTLPKHIDESINQLCSEIEEIADLLACIAGSAGELPLEAPKPSEDPFEIVH